MRFKGKRSILAGRRTRGMRGDLSMTTPSIDLDRLLKLRIIVARFGEMDLARWWNTKGQLGRLGAVAVRRGFPRTPGDL